MTPRTVRREITDADYQPAAYIAELFHKSAQTIYGWGKRGEIRKIVKGGTTMYSVADCRTKVRKDNVVNALVAPKESIENGKYLTLESRSMTLEQATPIISDLMNDFREEKAEAYSAVEAERQARKDLIDMSQAKLHEAPKPSPNGKTPTIPVDALTGVEQKIAERKHELLIQIADHEEAIAALKAKVESLEEKEVIALEAREALNKMVSLLSEF